MKQCCAAALPQGAAFLDSDQIPAVLATHPPGKPFAAAAAEAFVSLPLPRAQPRLPGVTLSFSFSFSGSPLIVTGHLSISATTAGRRRDSPAIDIPAACIWCKLDRPAATGALSLPAGWGNLLVGDSGTWKASRRFECASDTLSPPSELLNYNQT